MSSHAPTVSPGIAPPESTAAAARRLLQRVARRYIAHQTRRALLKLPPWQLADLGLSVSEIDAVADRVARQSVGDASR